MILKKIITKKKHYLFLNFYLLKGGVDGMQWREIKL